MSFIASFKPRNLRIDSTKTGFSPSFQWVMGDHRGLEVTYIREQPTGGAEASWSWSCFAIETQRWVHMDLKWLRVGRFLHFIPWVHDWMSRPNFTKNCWIDWCWCFCFFLVKAQLATKNKLFKIVESVVFHNFWNIFIPSLFTETGSCLNEKLVVVSPWPIA